MIYAAGAGIGIVAVALSVVGLRAQRRPSAQAFPLGWWTVAPVTSEMLAAGALAMLVAHAVGTWWAPYALLPFCVWYGSWRARWVRRRCEAALEMEEE